MARFQGERIWSLHIIRFVLTCLMENSLRLIPQHLVKGTDQLTCDQFDTIPFLSDSVDYLIILLEGYERHSRVQVRNNTT